MEIKQLIEAVHINAVSHGWWDEDRAFSEILALIHSEWSEALEEARQGRPLVYKMDIESDDAPRFVTPEDANYAGMTSKPEGIAVELIDGVIRILDMLGKADIRMTNDDGGPFEFEELYSDTIPDVSVGRDEVPSLVCMLHYNTSLAYGTDPDTDGGRENIMQLMTAMAIALKWVRGQGLDPLKLLLEKHAYNKTRPYKHGKKF